MARRGMITYSATTGSNRPPTAIYYLAKPSDVMAFYLFDEPEEGQDNPWTLIDQLDRTKLLSAGNKGTAKLLAKRLAFTHFVYVRV
ncbi:hypothetical protein DYGSA30_30790 [Dyella sp. GSA-30]|nr:hypothetical protein DYGSA30_30790 [Dyella sp. GSA-30]